MTETEEAFIRSVIAKQTISAMAKRWDDLAFEAICGGVKPPEPTSCTIRNGHFVQLPEPPREPYWSIVRTDCV